MMIMMGALRWYGGMGGRGRGREGEMGEEDVRTYWMPSEPLISTM